MAKNYFLFWTLIFFVFVGFIPESTAKMRSNNKIRAGTPPYEIIKRMLTSNSKALDAGIRGEPSKFAPYLTWLTDSDPRISSEMVLKEARLYTVRNLGGQLEPAAGAIDYGVRYLLTPVLLITVNSDNQAIKFFMEGYGGLSPAIREELDHLHLALARDNKKLEIKERLTKNIEANVDFQVDMALARYQDRVQSGRLVVIGSILDVTNEYLRGTGRLIIININGERDTAKLRNLPILKTLSTDFKKTSFGRNRPQKKVTKENLKVKKEKE